MQGVAEPPFTPKQVAALFNVSTNTVYNWAEDGKLPYFLTPGGHRRFRRQDVERLLEAGSAA